MAYNVYFDESGDLGWTLDKPFRRGGSSRFFTIAYLIISEAEQKHISRFLRKFHKERGGQNKEIKGSAFSKNRAKTIARKVVEDLLWNKQIVIGAITITKTNVPTLFLNTKNDDVLYNYMVREAICDKIQFLEKAIIIPDRKSVPAGSQNSCSDLLKTRLWLELGSMVDIAYAPQESHNSEGLMIADWIANFVWRSFEDSDEQPSQILEQHLIENKLLF